MSRGVPGGITREGTGEPFLPWVRIPAVAFNMPWTKELRDQLGRPLLSWDLCPNCGQQAARHFSTGGEDLQCPTDVRPATKVDGALFTAAQRMADRNQLIVGLTVEEIITKDRAQKRELEDLRVENERLRKARYKARREGPEPDGTVIDPSPKRGYFVDG